MTTPHEVKAAINQGHQERFLKYVEKDPDGGCWKWTGAKLSGNSHPIFRFRGKSSYARRVAWILWREELTLHQHVFPQLTCRLEKMCVNPDHMMIGGAGSYYAMIRLAQKKVMRHLPRIISTLKHTAACREAGCSSCKDATDFTEGLERLIIHPMKPRQARKVSEK